jgi:hypothetical protein
LKLGGVAMRMIVALLLSLVVVCKAEAQGGAGGAGGAFQLFRFHVSKEGVQSPLWYADLNGGPLQFVESPAQYPLPGRGRIVSLALNVYENSNDGPLLATLRVNGADTSLVLTVPPGAVGVISVADEIPFEPNDLLSLEIDHSQASSGGLRATAGLHYVVLGSSVAEVPFGRTGLAVLGLALGASGIILLSLRRTAA